MPTVIEGIRILYFQRPDCFPCLARDAERIVGEHSNDIRERDDTNGQTGAVRDPHAMHVLVNHELHNLFEQRVLVHTYGLFYAYVRQLDRFTNDRSDALAVAGREEGLDIVEKLVHVARRKPSQIGG